MDWIGPITPTYSITGARYMLLMVDYFTRFIWAKAYRDYTKVKVIYIYYDYLTLIFGWPEGCYSDNSSHFANTEVQAIFLEHGVSHFTGPISYPLSTGLLERLV